MVSVKAPTNEPASVANAIQTRSYFSDFNAALIRVCAHTQIKRSDWLRALDYGLLRKIGASHVEPLLDDAFLVPDAWTSLSVNHNV